MRGLAAGMALTALGLAGCATLSRGTVDAVAVVSDPPGATVTTSLGIRCAATPCTLAVNRDTVFTVTIARAGYATRTVPVTTRIAGAGAALATENIATGGLGLVVDATTGAALEHVPPTVDVTLTRLSTVEPPRPPR